MTDNLTRFLGSLIIVTGVGLFVWFAAASSPLHGLPPILIPPLLLILAGAFIANKADS